MHTIEKKSEFNGNNQSKQRRSKVHENSVKYLELVIIQKSVAVCDSQEEPGQALYILQKTH